MVFLPNGLCFIIDEHGVKPLTEIYGKHIFLAKVLRRIHIVAKKIADCQQCKDDCNKTETVELGSVRPLRLN